MILKYIIIFMILILCFSNLWLFIFSRKNKNKDYTKLAIINACGVFIVFILWVIYLFRI